MSAKPTFWFGACPRADACWLDPFSRTGSTENSMPKSRFSLSGTAVALHERPDLPGELVPVQQRGPQCTTCCSTTNGLIQAVRVAVQVGATPRLRLSQVDPHGGGLVHQAE